MREREKGREEEGGAERGVGESRREYEYKNKSASEYISMYFHGLRKSIEVRI